jgi:hypothetical protein
MLNAVWDFSFLATPTFAMIVAIAIIITKLAYKRK